jgi:hypothetical protein
MPDHLIRSISIPLYMNQIEELEFEDESGLKKKRQTMKENIREDEQGTPFNSGESE